MKREAPVIEEATHLHHYQKPLAAALNSVLK
jgi:hypothetical protein